MSTESQMGKLGCLAALLILSAGCDDSSAGSSRPDACGPLAPLDAGTPDASQGEGSGASGGASESPAPVCPGAPIRACESMRGWMGFGWSVVAEAATFGENARFVAGGTDAVLVEGGDEPWRVVRIAGDKGGVYVPDRIWTFPAGSWRGLDAVLLLGTRFPGVLALACGTASDARCRLLYGEDDGLETAAAELTELAGAEVPQAIEPRGLVYDPGLDAICVYGNGLVCFDTRWKTMIGPDCGVEIRDVSWASRIATMIAVAERGRWWTRVIGPTGEVEPWVEQVRIESEDEPVGVSVMNNVAALFGKRTVWPVSAQNGRTRSCVQDGELRAAFADGTVVFPEGHIHRYLWDWCEEQIDLGTEPVIDWWTWTCIDGINPRVLTPTRLFGTTDCRIED